MSRALAKLKIKGTHLSAAVIATMLNSCSVFADLTPGLRVFDYGTGRVIKSLPPGQYREMICEGAAMHRSFFTLTQEDQSLIIRRRDGEGTERKRYKLPLLNSVWHEPFWLAVSPNGKRIAYWHSKTKSLRVRSLDSGDETTVFRGGKGLSTELDLITWKDSENIVIVSDPGIADFDYRDIYRISISGSVKHARTQFGLYPRLSLSPEKRLIGGVISVTHKPNPDWKQGDQVMIFNLDSMSEYLRAPKIRPRQRIGQIEWSDDGKSIVFPLKVSGDKVESMYHFVLASRNAINIEHPWTDDTMSAVGSKDGSMLFSSAGKLKWYNLGKKTWEECPRPTGRIVGWIPGTSRWLITDY